ncbi:DNA topoisomerase family protein [Pasteurella bettyae]|uniref:Topoisomerase DNA-binding C4 zinc finger domain protein n=1 Tax=Pasteurella bettyae CCUG 2042 TaxID=1095749 RepID=I3D9X8_9PAST|nr:type I DNA topoisomerase [Pasteurella bettyae]EIJ68521.1 topoisomerase DNA-binding C4 zinc finger domain protein [Pasteurella bettyae CCUG 2042]
MSEPLFQHTKSEEICPQCGSPLQMKQGKKGLFLGCSAYPQCDFIKPLHAQTESRVIKELNELCPECGHPLYVKQGTFGMFIGCSNYPDCNFIVHEQPETHNEENITCPECHKGLLIARRGRQGKTFYACNQFPQCKFTLPSKPYPITCPQCGEAVCTLKKQSETHRTLICANKTCKHSFEQKRTEEI